MNREQQFVKLYNHMLEYGFILTRKQVDETLDLFASLTHTERKEETCILCEEHEPIGDDVKVCKYCENRLRNEYLP